MAEYLAPGVYVEEFDSGIKAMEGVGTSTAGFIGMAQKGPVCGLPVLVTSMADYRRRFGGYLSEREYGERRFLPYAVEQFFNNGGSSCYVMRVCASETEDGASGSNKEDIASRASGSVGSFFTLKALNPGAWGNQLQARFDLNTKNRIKIESIEGTDPCFRSEGYASGYQPGDIVCLQSNKKKLRYNVIKEIAGNDTGGSNIKLKSNLNALEKGETWEYLYLAEWNFSVWDETASEQYESVSLHPERGNCVVHMLEKSQLVSAELQTDGMDTLGQLLSETTETYINVSFSGGSDGKIELDASSYIGKDGAPDERTGLTAFQTLQDVNIMAVPGITEAAVQSALITHCENMNDRFAVLDMPLDMKDVSKLQEFRENFDTSYAAMYHPWLQCYDALMSGNRYMPPSGAVAGIYARTDISRGVHKAPANEVVRSCTGLSVKYNEAEQGKLNPRGINLIRALPGQGIRVWGARTCSSDGNWKYVNVRRLFLYIEQSIKANTGWAVFEPNDELLWSRVEGTIRVFLITLWRNGALMGTTADEAFYISIGRTTMTEDDILNGRLICEIGVAPVRPAEFVVFRITQKMESAQ